MSRYTDRAIATLRAHAFGCSSLFAHSFLYSHLHQSEVSVHAVCLGAEYGLGAEDLMLLRAAADLHDIGKIPLLETIRQYQHKALETDGEGMQIIRQHSEIGARGIEAMAIASPMLAETFFAVASLVRTHHECWNGSGYPKGLKGDEIPILSRMLAIADAAKAMTTPERQWRQPLTVEQMLAEIRACAGTQFDPQLAEVYCYLIEHNRIHYHHTMIGHHV